MLKIAILGGTGLLGSNLFLLYQKKGLDVRVFSRNSSDSIPTSFNTLLDFERSFDTLTEALTGWKPDIIINAIANVNLQVCEEKQAEAHKINVDFPQQFSLLAQALGSYYIHISSDHFYDDGLLKHTERDVCLPINHYAATKLKAENVVLEAYPSSLIVRTNIIGFRRTERPSFFEWLINALYKEEEITLYEDYFTSPIAVQQLGKILLDCYSHHLRGIYNIASRDVISKYEFGLETARQFGFSTQAIKKGSLALANAQSPLKRSRFLGLDVSKVESALQIKMPSVIETIEELHQEFCYHQEEKYEL